MLLNIAVIFGGQSCEHEISILSALQVMYALEEEYHVLPIYISKTGEFYSFENLKDIECYREDNFIAHKNRVHFQKKEQEVYCVKNIFKKDRIDFVIPVLHGTNGEDGSIQGFLEMYNLPYCGSSLLSSAIAQSKIMCKKILRYYQFPILSFKEYSEIEEEAPFLPCIIKPDSLGSSIGIEIVQNKKDWQYALAKALLYDEKCIVEPYIAQFQEINCAIMRVKGEIITSHLEEVIKKENILSFKDKYSNSLGKQNSNRHIDPVLKEETQNEIIKIAKEIYEKFHFKGVIRIDFMLIEEQVVVNEINTIPGSYAFYLWKPKDLKTVLKQCIEEGMQNYQKKLGRITSFESGVLFDFKRGSKG